MSYLCLMHYICIRDVVDRNGTILIKKNQRLPIEKSLIDRVNGTVYDYIIPMMNSLDYTVYILVIVSANDLLVEQREYTHPNKTRRKYVDTYQLDNYFIPSREIWLNQI